MSIGSALGTYDIISRLSVGGMGEVYLAEDTRLHRKVALKVLPPEWGSDTERRERFQWEARVLATLNHPNIVTIYSVEQAGDVHFFTMELVEGQTLRELIPVQGLALEPFLKYAIPLADSLAAAHQRGIIHRDIKPGNIMIRPDGRLKILDFGLAKREPGNGLDDAEASELWREEPQTQDGRLLGTVAYMSPEQAAGRPLDHRTDLFTLGIVYYEMLTGVRPFEERDWADKIAAHLHDKEPLPAPPEAQVPDRLEGIVHRCLERDPAKRYQTAEELREELTELQLEIVVSGSFSSTQITRPNFGRPKRWWGAALLGALASFTLAAGFVVPRWLDGKGGAASPGLSSPEKEYLEASHTPNAQAYEAYLRGMASNMEALEAYRRGMHYANRHEPSPKNWRLAVDMFERAVRLDPEFAQAHAELSRVHSFFYHQTIDRSEERLRSARAAADRALEIDPNLPGGHRALGYYYYWGLGDYEKALTQFEIAIRQMPNDGQLYEGIAYIRRRQGRFDEALESFEKAMELDSTSNWLAAERAHTLSNLRRFAEADREYDRAISLAPDQPHPYQMRALNVLRWTGDVNRARMILAEMPGQTETSSLYTRFKVEIIARNYEGAIATARAIESDLVGLDSALFPKEMSLGAAHHFLDRVATAVSHYQIARRILEAKVEERPGDPRLRSALGLTYAGLARAGEDYKDKAIAEGRRAVELHPVTKDAFVGPDFLELLAQIYAWVGEADAAIDLLEDLLGRPSSLSRSYLEIYPSWDPIRDHPRFVQLLARSS